MASTNKTSLGLNMWEASDKPVRMDFNNDNTIIDQSITKLNSDLTDLNSSLTIKDFSEWVNVPAGEYVSGVQRYSNSAAANCKQLLFVLQHDNRGSDSVYEYVNIVAPYGSFPSSYYKIITNGGELLIYYANTGIIDLITVPIRLRQIRYLK